MSDQTIEQRITALEVKIEELEQKYQDLAYEYLDSLITRIETIRDEVNASLDSVEGRIHTEAFQKITKAVEEARVKLAHDVIAEAIIPELTSGRHVLVTRPASFEEQRTGKGIPVKQALHRG